MSSETLKKKVFFVSRTFRTNHDFFSCIGYVAINCITNVKHESKGHGKKRMWPALW